MRPALLSLLLGTSVGAAPLSIGGEVGLLLKAEADGRHTARPDLGVRGQYELGRWLSLDGLYSVSHVREGARFAASGWGHGLDLRLSAVLPLSTSRLLLGAGPALRLSTLDLFDGGEHVASRAQLSAGAGVGAAILASVRGVEARFGVDASLLRAQWDWRLTAGVQVPFGGTR